jgi:protein O-mannosyl-transferase
MKAQSQRQLADEAGVDQASPPGFAGDVPRGVTQPPDHWKPWMLAAVVSVLLLACYWPVIPGGILWDDQAHITSPELRPLHGLLRIWLDPHATQQYYPVLHSAFWLEWRLWGEATIGYHLTNILLHALSCCLLALVLQRLRFRNGAAVLPPAAGWLAALLFAVHPVCVESVAWISEQKNTLSLVFYLLAGLAWLDFHATRKPRVYATALLFFALALGTKSVTATLPAALLVILWWQNGELIWRRDIRPLVPWFLLALAAGLFTALVERRLIGAEGAEFDLSFYDRVLLAARVVWFYFAKLVWPANLMFVYPRWDVTGTASGWMVYLLAAIGVTALLWFLRRRARGPLAAWLFFVGSLFPALGFFNVYPFIFSFVADHFQYLAAMGFLAGSSTGIVLLLAKAPAGARGVGGFFCGALVVALAVLSHRQSRMYLDGETLYRETIARNPACWMALNNLAVELVKLPSGLEEGIACYEAALKVRPDYPEAHNNLAVELAKMPGRKSEAIAHYEQALKIRPDYAEAHGNLAVELGQQPGREPEALKHFGQALHLKPNYPELHYNLAILLGQMPGREPEAVMQYEQTLRLNPDYVEAHYNLAATLARIPGRESDAAGHYEQVLRLRPGHADAHVGLGNLWSKIPGREADAVAQYEEALRLTPEVAGIHYNLASVLARIPGREAEALDHFETALQLQPDYLDARFGYANELARLPGRAPEAIAQYEGILSANPARADVHYRLGVLFSNQPGKLADAAFHYEETLRIQPEFAAAHNNLAIIYARQGRRADAKAHWEKALELNPDYEDAKKNLELLQRLPIQ